MEQEYDIAFVGAGISSAYTLKHYVALLEEHPPAQPVRVIVLEKSGEFWAGVPYGARSGHAALLISSLKEFIPQEPERTDFKAWLNQNWGRLLDSPGEVCGQLTASWLLAHADAISVSDWDDLYLLRFLFGVYLHERLTTLLDEARAKGLVEFKLQTASVVDIERLAELWRLTLESDQAIWAKKVVLAIGGPPYGSDTPLQPDAASSDDCCINNMYEPSLDANIQRICECLERSSNDQVLILGSNASALETIYNLANSKQVMSLIGKVTILSPSAAFPHRVNQKVTPTNYHLTHLEALVESSSRTSQDILTAVEKDVAGAAEKQINIADLYHDI